MYPKSNGTLRHGGLPLREALRAALLASLPALVTGCPGPEPHAGVGGNGGEGTTTGLTITDTTASTSCGPSAICAEPVPTGWQGPFLVVHGQDPACPSGSISAWTGGVSPVFSQASCPCTCTATTPASCGTPKVELWPTQTACGNASGSSSSSSSSSGSAADAGTNQPCAGGPLTSNCTLLKDPTNTLCGTGTTDLWATVTIPILGTCNPTPVSKPPMPSWGTNYVGCEDGKVPIPCGAGACAPAPSPGATSSGVCISQMGNVACPPAPSPYTAKTTVFTTFMDNRDCSTCMCEPPQGKCQGGEVTFASNSACNTTAASDPLPLACTPVSIPASNPYYAELNGSFQISSSTCSPAPGGGTATGTVMPAGALTVCCTM